MHLFSRVAGIIAPMLLLAAVPAATVSAQQTYWTGKYRQVAKDCNAGELEISVGFTVDCVAIRTLKDDTAFQEVLGRLQQSEAHAAMLESNIKALAAANDALTKRVNDLEAAKPGQQK